MKKLIVLALVLTSFMLFACNDKKDTTEADKKATEGKFEKVQEPPIPTFGDTSK